MKRLSILISCMVFGFIVSIMYIPHAKAADINVPDDYSTIQEAINAAGDGDVVIVDPETYYENINFSGKAITVKSTDPNDPDVVANTIIDGKQADCVVTFDNGEDPDSILSGLTVRNDRGIHCKDSSPTITNCLITQNWTGISINQSRPSDFQPNIINCIIRENVRGIDCSGSCNINNCTISENYEGGIRCTEYASPSPWSLIPGLAKPKIINCTIIGNGHGYLIGISGSKGGIYCVESSPTIAGCNIIENFGIEGGGITIFGSSPNISNCVIARNSGEKGGGIYCPTYIILAPQELGEPYFYFPRPKITNCTITENSARESGGGIFSDIYACVFMVGPVPIPIGRIFNPFPSPIITNCIIWGNFPDDVGGVKIRITHSNVQGGYLGRRNINIDPLFVDPNAGDYRLQPDSPCIERGKRRCDMGAYGTYDYNMPWSRSGRYLRR